MITNTDTSLFSDNSSYAILEFNPYVTPNTLRVANYYNTSEGNLKAWLSRHPVNPSKCPATNYVVVSSLLSHIPTNIPRK